MYHLKLVLAIFENGLYALKFCCVTDLNQFSIAYTNLCVISAPKLCLPLYLYKHILSSTNQVLYLPKYFFLRVYLHTSIISFS